MSAITIRALRWAPGDTERRQTYQVTAGDDTTVLDALVEIQRTQDPTLGFRYACRVGMCGSCAMVVNGRERWACRMRLASLGADVVDVRPLYHLPVLRDLVVDMSPFHDRLRAVGAALVPRPGAAPYALSPAMAPSGGRSTRPSSALAAGCAYRPAPWWRTLRIFPARRP